MPFERPSVILYDRWYKKLIYGLLDGTGRENTAGRAVNVFLILLILGNVGAAVTILGVGSFALPAGILADIKRTAKKRRG